MKRAPRFAPLPPVPEPPAVPIKPFEVGDRVTLWGVPGVIEAIAYSHATEKRVITVVLDTRISMRVAPSDIVPA